MKKIAALTVLISCLNLAMAQDTVKIFINGKAAGTAVTKGDENISTITIKKIKASSLKSVTVKLGGNLSGNAVYKKTIQAMDGDAVLLTAGETKNAAGNFSLPIKLLDKKLVAGKKIKLVLQLNPANDKMMMPSREMQLCYILMQ